MKYLGPAINDQKPFAYNIKLNGTIVDGAKTELSPSGSSIVVSGGKGKSYVLPATPQNITLSSPFIL